MNWRDWLLGVAGVRATGGASAAGTQRLPALPDAPADWLGGAVPVLEGRPVLIEFWTYGCYNCRNLLPWMKAMHARHTPRGLTIVAVHTPEFPAERATASVAKAVERHAIPYPVLLDPDAKIWAAFENAYWPAVYLFDHLHVRIDAAIGELHLGTARGDRMEAQIRAVVDRARPTRHRANSAATARTHLDPRDAARHARVNERRSRGTSLTALHYRGNVFGWHTCNPS